MSPGTATSLSASPRDFSLLHVRRGVTMLSPAHRRLSALALGTRSVLVGARSISTNDNPVPVNRANAPTEPAKNVSQTNKLPTSSTGAGDMVLQEDKDLSEEMRAMQAPNRKGIWARSQRPREQAMTGPRFEQAIMKDQPRPLAAIELIHKQPVRWVDSRQVSCDGGGGPLGHPRIFINVDKPQICWCTYCGVPFAHEHHRKMLEAQSTTTYPLKASGDPAEVPESQRVTDEAFGQR